MKLPSPPPHSFAEQLADPDDGAQHPHPFGAETVEWTASQAPFNPRFHDIYRSMGSTDKHHPASDQGLAQARHVFLAACGLLGENALWRDQAQWSVLENGFGLGLNFLATYQAWLLEPHRPQHLHYCAIEAFPVSPSDLHRSAAGFKELAPFCTELLSHYWGLTPGFHRITLAQGFVHLTLCIGDAKDMLHQIQGHFDSIYLDGFDPQKNPHMWDELTMRGIASKAKWGACAATWSVSGQVRKNLQAVGFECEKRPGLPPKREGLKAIFSPPWREQMLVPRPQVMNSSHEPSVLGRGASKPEPVIVIGAGLAGANTAFSLAMRGFKVLVLDQHSAPQKASPHGGDTEAEPVTSSERHCNALAEKTHKSPLDGAHGLPFGLFHPMSSRDDNLQSKMTRAGIRVLLDNLKLQPSMSEQVDFMMCGVLEKKKASKRDPWIDLHPEANNAPHDFTQVTPTSEDQDKNQPLYAPRERTWSEHWSIKPSPDQLDWLGLDPRAQATLATTPQELAVFHEKAGWVDVQAWISCLLSHPNITVQAHEKVTQLEFHSSQSSESSGQPKTEQGHFWRVITARVGEGKTVAHQHETHHYEAQQLLLCSSVATQELLMKRLVLCSHDKQMLHEELQQTLDSWPMQAIKGQLTVGEMNDLEVIKGLEGLEGLEGKPQALPSFALNGQSSWMGHLPPEERADSTGSKRFCIGASFERDVFEVQNSPHIRQSNLEKFKALMPSLQLRPEVTLTDWSGVRSTCHDRLPLVGPVCKGLEGLFVMCALGSRGLSMSSMLAEHMAGLLTQEPSPLPRRLIQAIDPQRFI